MSVRRLAEPAVQPAQFAFSAENAPWVEWTIGNYPAGRQQSAVIPLLMRAQEQEGWVTKAAIETVANMLDMPYIRVLEVATFYTQYQLAPVGTKAHVQVCGTTPCMLRGSEALMDVCRSKIHHDQFHTNEAGTLSWEEVECLGACVNAPMVMVFKDTYEDLTPERLAEMIDAFEAGNPPKPGPQVDRIYSAPASGLTSLKSEQAVIEDAREWQRKEREAAAASAKAVEAPPSMAAKPETDAIETNPAISSPSPVKTHPAAERAEGEGPMPAHDKQAANQAEPAVEDEAKQRKSRRPVSEDAEKKAPELQSGEKVGSQKKGRVASEAAEPGEPSSGVDRGGAKKRTTKKTPTEGED